MTKLCPLIGALLLCCLFPLPSRAAEVVIVADTRLKPVVEILSGMHKTLDASTRTYSPAEVRGRLRQVVEREEAGVVVALGREALAEALQLPSSIPVIFDMVVTPPTITRPNTTGFYMATPVREYCDLIRKHLHSLRKLAVVGSRDQLRLLDRDDSPQVTAYNVDNPAAFVATVNRLEGTDAIILLPDAALLTNGAMEEAFLLSFRKHMPLLGISEQHVREGALLALVVDPVNVGRLIGDYAHKALNGADLGRIPPAPPRKFLLYLNTNTARRMGISVPDELKRLAARVYP